MSYMYRGWQLPTQSLLALPIGGVLYMLREDLPFVFPIALLTVFLAARFHAQLPSPSLLVSPVLLVISAVITGGWFVAGVVAILLLALTVLLNRDRIALADAHDDFLEQDEEWLTNQKRRQLPPNGGVVIVDRKELLEMGTEPVTSQLAEVIRTRKRQPAEIAIIYNDDSVAFSCQGRQYIAFEDGVDDSIDANGEVAPRNLVAMAQLLDDWLGTTHGTNWTVRHVNDGLFTIVDCDDEVTDTMLERLNKVLWVS